MATIRKEALSKKEQNQLYTRYLLYVIWLPRC